MEKKKTFKVSEIFDYFLQSQQNSGALLIIFTIVSFSLANSPFNPTYQKLIHLATNNQYHLPDSILNWINEGFMTLFFLLIGIEIKRELNEGELKNRKNAMLPLIGALGGMIIPAAIYCFVNFNSPTTLSGAGIPMATDIAFAIAILSLLGNRIPVELKIFLTALAIIDDLGAIVIIAIFYGHGLHFTWLISSLAICVLMFLLNKKKTTSLLVYVLIGIALWYCILQSGIHASISGVLFAFLLPNNNIKKINIPNKIEHFLNKPVAFIILPMFAATNTALTLNNESLDFSSPISLGILGGLLIGKPLGIFGFSYLSNKLNIARISPNISLKNLLGASFLGGIGFTMSIFIANLAFSNIDYTNIGKISILFASSIAAISGYFICKIPNSTQQLK
jgi:NhaA family Na+:H+ antiporter